MTAATASGRSQPRRGRLMPNATKRRVTMTSVVASPNGEIATHQAVDYVPEDVLDAYVADAKTRWQAVEVSDEQDHGPAGPDGDTAELAHLAAGRTLQDHLAAESA